MSIRQLAEEITGAQTRSASVATINVTGVAATATAGSQGGTLQAAKINVAGVTPSLILSPISRTASVATINVVGVASAAAISHTLQTATIRVAGAAASFTHTVPVFLFEPPVIFDVPRTIAGDRGPAGLLFRRFSPLPRGQTVLKINGDYITVSNPNGDLSDSAETVYVGGHIYEINADEAAALQAAGYTVNFQSVGVPVTPPPDLPPPLPPAAQSATCQVATIQVRAVTPASATSANATLQVATIRVQGVAPTFHQVTSRTLQTATIRVTGAAPTGSIASLGPLADDFNGTALNTATWTFEDPRGGSSVSVSGGLMRISVAGLVDHDSYTALLSPRISQQISTGDFYVEEKMTTSVANDQDWMGLLVTSASEQQWVRAGFVRISGNVYCFGGYSLDNGVTVTGGPVVNLGAAAAPLWIRLYFVGSTNSWTVEYSTNGTTFTNIGTFVANIANVLPTLVNPAPSTVGYTTLAIPAGGGQFNLTNSVDYVVSAPTAITAPVSIVGGRNVVWRGGEINIGDQGVGAIGDFTRRGLTVSDGVGAGLVDGRIVHLEGLLIHGPDLDEGIDIAAPTAIVRIANTEILNVHFRGSDDRDGTGVYIPGGDHPNLVQSWGGFKQLWIDGLRGEHSYEGIRIQDDNNGTTGPTHLRRVHLRAVGTSSPEARTYSGHTNLAWARDVNKAGKLYIDPGTVFSEHAAAGGWVAATPNPRTWPTGFEAFQGGFYFGRAGIATPSGFTSVSTQHTWDTTTESWQANNASSIAFDNTRHHDGTGSLRVTGSYGTGFTAINPVGPSITVGSRNKSGLGGTVLAVWVMLDAAATGTGWMGALQVRDSSFNVHQSNYAALTPGAWVQLSFDASLYLSDVEKWGVSVARNSGTAGSFSFNVDTMQIGTQTFTTSYQTDPEPGTAVPTDTFHVFPATVSTGSDTIGPYVQMTHADLTDEAGASPAKVYAMAPVPSAQIPNGLAGVSYLGSNRKMMLAAGNSAPSFAPWTATFDYLHLATGHPSVPPPPPPPSSGRHLFGGFRFGASQSNLDAYEAFFNRKVEVVLMHGGYATWDLIQAVGQSGITEFPGRPISYTADIIPWGATYADLTAGAYDGYWYNQVNQIVNVYNHPDAILRVCHEFNVSDYPWWAVIGNGGYWTPAQHVGMFRRYVQVARTVPNQRLKFDWCYGFDEAGVNVFTDGYYPGDDVVDIIGCDLYNRNLSPDWNTRWNMHLTVNNGLNNLASFAATHKKLISFPEMMNANYPDYPPANSGDDTVFIDNVAAWIAAQPVEYFDWYCDGPPIDSDFIDEPATWPGTRAHLLSLYGR